jgi:hypothetical protein
MHLAIQSLVEYLGTLPAGPVQDLRSLVNYLADAWPRLHGSSYSGMRAEKLYRLESPEWKPPVLTFKIERHGGTVMGSTRAEVQHWEVDTRTGSAQLVRNTRRQLHSMATRWSAESLAAELAEAIRNGKDHAKLNWRKKGTVALTGDSVPGGFKQTVSGRKKRLKAAIAKALGNDWQEKEWRSSQ